MDSNGQNNFSISKWIFLVIILLAALFMRLAGIWRTEPIDYHPDEWVIAKPVLKLANEGYIGLKTHYKWPACSVIYPFGYTLYALKGWLGPYSYNTILIIQRIISAITATAAVWVGFLLVRKIFSTRAAFWAAILITVANEPVLDGHYGTIDSIVSLVILTVMLLSYDLFDVKPEQKKVKAASCCSLGIICGLGTAAKWSVLLSVIPISGAFLLSIWVNRKLGHWKDFVKLNLQKIAIISGMTILSFLAGIPDFQLVPDKIISGITYEVKHHNTGHYGAVIPDNDHPIGRIKRTFDHIGICGSKYLAIAGTLATLLFLLRPTRGRVFLLWSMLGWLAVLTKNLIAPIRHYLVPFIIMLLIISVVLDMMTENKKLWFKLAGYCVFVLLVITAALYTCIWTSPFWKPDARILCGKWIRQNVPAGSGINWAPQTAIWSAPGQVVDPSLFNQFPRRALPGKPQYIIASARTMRIFEKHPPTRKIVPSEWFPGSPPSMKELTLYDEINHGGGPNLEFVRKFEVKPSFLGLDLSLFGIHGNADTTFASQTVSLFLVKTPDKIETPNEK